MGMYFIPWFIPLAWAILVTIFWRYKFSDPVNHWLICILIFGINYLFFSYAFIIFVIIAIFEKNVFKFKKEKKAEDE